MPGTSAIVSGPWFGGFVSSMSSHVRPLWKSCCGAGGPASRFCSFILFIPGWTQKWPWGLKDCQKPEVNFDVH